MCRQRNGHFSYVLLALLLALLAAGCGRGSAAAPRRHEVVIERFEFRPAELRVAVGDTVVCINRDLVPHTATDSAGGWDSGSLKQGASWSHVPREAGEWAYLCALHPSMKGRVVVR